MQEKSYFDKGSKPHGIGYFYDNLADVLPKEVERLFIDWSTKNKFLFSDPDFLWRKVEIF